MFRAVLFSLLAAIPTSTNYVLQTYDFGSGSGNGSSTNYNLSGTAGAQSGSVSSASYSLPAGIQSSSSVSAPPAPALTNPSSSYDSLRITLNTGGAASDTKFAVAVSDDNFATTKYLKADLTLGTTFTVSNYQTYAAWGGAGGAAILGLSANTTYKAKVAALKGPATGSAFGPEASANTTVPSVTFGLATSLTSTPPFSAAFASLPSGSVVTASASITPTVTTNANGGGSVQVRSQNAGLTSGSASYTIPSATADLAVAARGYGAQVTSTAQSGGGPVVSTNPFNSAASSVGGLTAGWQQIASFAGPVTNGSATFNLLAKADASVPSAANYSDVITLTISLLF